MTKKWKWASVSPCIRYTRSIEAASRLSVAAAALSAAAPRPSTATTTGTATAAASSRAIGAGSPPSSATTPSRPAWTNAIRTIIR